MCVHWGQPSGSASTCKVSPSSGLPLLNGKTNQPIYYEDAPVSCRLCLMMGGGVLIKICSKAVRSHLHFWWSWWLWWWWQWWRTLSHIDAQKPIYGIKYLWEFGCTPERRRGCGCKADDVGGVCAMVLVSAQVRQVLLDPTNHHQFGREHITHSTEYLAHSA